VARGVSARLTAAEGRKFGLVVGGAFLVLGALLAWRTHVVAASVAAAVGSALIVAGIILPTRLGPVYRGWMALAHAISKVTTPIVMSAVYFLVFMPTGLVARLLGHRPLSRPSGAGTYWKSRPAGARQGEMDHQF
jgi:Saxitoxin biosynthesis operon protein SxtJ